MKNRQGRPLELIIYLRQRFIQLLAPDLWQSWQKHTLQKMPSLTNIARSSRSLHVEN